MALENLNAEQYVRKFVEGEKKTHKEVSELLKQAYPNTQGLSERSVRRFCEVNNIHLRDRKLSTSDLDAAVSSAIVEVSIVIRSSCSV